MTKRLRGTRHELRFKPKTSPTFFIACPLNDDVEKEKPVLHPEVYSGPCVNTLQQPEQIKGKNSTRTSKDRLQRDTAAMT